MSFLHGINDPKDMLLKLIREANRINFESEGENIKDHFFNFSVTAHSLRDWCFKYQRLESSKKQMNMTWDNEPFLVVAKDIANSVKHFGISLYTPNIAGSAQKNTMHVVLRTGSNLAEDIEKAKIDPDFRDENSEESPSYKIYFTDGSTISLNDYIFKTVLYWIGYFDSNGIPRDNKVDQRHIYVNRRIWHKFT